MTNHENITEADKKKFYDRQEKKQRKKLARMRLYAMIKILGGSLIVYDALMREQELFPWSQLVVGLLVFFIGCSPFIVDKLKIKREQ